MIGVINRIMVSTLPEQSETSPTIRPEINSTESFSLLAQAENPIINNPDGTRKIEMGNYELVETLKGDDATFTVREKSTVYATYSLWGIMTSLQNNAAYLAGFSNSNPDPVLNIEKHLRLENVQAHAKTRMSQELQTLKLIRDEVFNNGSQEDGTNIGDRIQEYINYFKENSDKLDLVKQIFPDDSRSIKRDEYDRYCRTQSHHYFIQDNDEMGIEFGNLQLAVNNITDTLTLINPEIAVA